MRLLTTPFGPLPFELHCEFRDIRRGTKGAFCPVMQPSSKLVMAPKRESLPRNWDDYPEPMSQYAMHEPTARQSTMRIPIKVTDDLQRQLGCDGFALEPVFIEQDPSLTAVLVYYVDLAQNLINASSPVVKFSKGAFAIPRVEFLKLATPEYYCTYEGLVVASQTSWKADTGKMYVRF